MTDVTMHGARLAKIGLLAAVISRVFGRLVGIGLVVLLARESDPDTVAIYGYLLGAATLVATFTDLGVAAVAGREVAAGRMPVDGALYAALIPQSLSVLAAAAATVLLTVAAGPASVPWTAIALTALFVVVGGFVNLWAELLRATGRVVLEGWLQMGSAVALVVGGVVVVYGGGDVTDLLLIVVAKEAVVLVIMMVLIHPRRRAQVRTRQLLGQSLWVALGGTAVILLWRQGTFVVATTGTVGALATYVVATRFLDAGVTVAHTAGFGLVPGMSALANHPAEFRRAARQYISLATVVGAGVAVIGMLAASPLTTIPFGENWGDAVPVVRLIALSALPILVAFVAWPFLLARNQVKWLAVGALIATVAGLSISLIIATWRPDATAPAIGTACGATVLALIFLVGLRDLLLRNHNPTRAGQLEPAVHEATANQTPQPRPTPESGNPPVTARSTEL